MGDVIWCFWCCMFQAGENPASVWAASGELLSGSTVTSSMISDDFRNQQSKWWITWGCTSLQTDCPGNRPQTMSRRAPAEKSNDKNLYKIFAQGLRKYRARSSWAAWARPRNKNLLRLQPTRSYKSLHRSSSAYRQDSHGTMGGPKEIHQDQDLPRSLCPKDRVPQEFADAKWKGSKTCWKCHPWFMMIDLKGFQPLETWGSNNDVDNTFPFLVATHFVTMTCFFCTYWTALYK